MDQIMRVYANLHTHSTHSDGAYSPRKIAEIAKNEGYGALAITDHDTFTGNAEAAEACRELGLCCIPGIEFSLKGAAFKTWFHMTAFHFDPEYPEMKEYLRQLSERETHQTEVCFHRGVREGFIEGITWDEVLDYNRGITWLCNEHVFRAMQAKGIADILDYPAFFENVYGKHRAEVPPLHDFMQAEDMISLVHRAGGIIFLAHPFTPQQMQCVPELAKIGLDGIEVWHSDLDAKMRREALAAAGEHDLFISGGSDHSGLCGGQYERYADPTETQFYFPPQTLGTTEFFFREIASMKKSAGRGEIIKDLLADDSLWQRVK